MGGVQQSPGGGRAGRAGSRGTTDVGRLAFVALGLAMTVACVAGDSASSRSGVVLVVERISAPGPGTAGGTNRTFVESDVVTGGVVIQDTALATLRLVAKDPGAATNPAAPSGVQFAAIDRYRVRYVRSDGRDAPGIDVPHPWEGVLTLTTSFDGRTGEFVLVPASAKAEERASSTPWPTSPSPGATTPAPGSKRSVRSRSSSPTGPTPGRRRGEPMRPPARGRRTDAAGEAEVARAAPGAGRGGRSS